MSKVLNEAIGTSGFDGLFYDGMVKADVKSLRVKAGQGELLRGSVLAIPDHSEGVVSVYYPIAQIVEVDTTAVVTAAGLDTGSLKVYDFKGGHQAFLTTDYTIVYAQGVLTITPNGEGILDGLDEVYVECDYTAQGQEAITYECTPDNDAILLGAPMTKTIELDAVGGSGVIKAPGLDIDTLVVYDEKDGTELDISDDYTVNYENGILKISAVGDGDLAAAEEIYAVCDYTEAGRNADCILSDDLGTGDDEGTAVLGVAYRTGHFAIEKLHLADEYSLTKLDIKNLRDGGILLSNLMPY